MPAEYRPKYRSWEVDQADAGNQLILSCKSGQTLIFIGNPQSIEVNGIVMSWARAKEF
jgi:hypothetical protein